MVLLGTLKTKPFFFSSFSVFVGSVEVQYTDAAHQVHHNLRYHVYFVPVDIKIARRNRICLR